MSDPQETLRRSKILIANAQRDSKAEELLELLPQGHGSGLNADTVDGLHAAEIIAKAPGKGGGGSGSGGSGDMTKAVYDTDNDGVVDNAEKMNGHSEAEVQDHAPKSHALDGHTGTLEDTQCEGTAATKANTTPAAFSSWASQPGTQRKVLVFDSVTGKPKWDYVYCYDIETPSPLPEISAFSVHPEGSYPDGTSGYAMVASSGEDQPHFALTYVGTPTACSIAVSPADADYPHALDSPFTSHLGPNVNRLTTVGSSITFTAKIGRAHV